MKFGTKFVEEGYLRSKTEEMTISIAFCIIESTFFLGYHVTSAAFIAFFWIAPYHYYFNVFSSKGCRDNKIKIKQNTLPFLKRFSGIKRKDQNIREKSRRNHCKLPILIELFKTATLQENLLVNQSR